MIPLVYEEVILLVATTAITSIIGSGGFIGILFWGVKRRWEKKLMEKERKAELAQQHKIKRRKLESDMRHAHSDLMFWLHKAVVSGEHNGELKKAFDDFQKVEDAFKDFENQLIAEMSQKEIS